MGERLNSLRPGVERAVKMGMELFRTAKQAAVVQADPVAQRERQMVMEHQQAVARKASAERSHKLQVTGIKTEAVLAGGTSGALAVGTVASGMGLGGLVMASLAAGSAALAVRFGRKARRVAANPPQVAIPPLPPPRLRPGARGAAQAERVRIALLHLYDLIPAVYTLHQDAGRDLVRAVSEVEPLLRAQVERLAALDRIELDMPGSAPAWAAAKGGDEVALRLDAGAQALEGLITASATLLAAPDLVDGVTEVLAPAIDSLTAYSYGLHRLNDTRGTY